MPLKARSICCTSAVPDSSARAEVSPDSVRAITLAST
jgi:hypothetical protein